MKGVIVGVCAFAIKTNCQFNFDINGGGVKFGILGSEVFSVGNQNNDRSSSPINLNMPNIPIPSIQVPSPFPLFTSVQATFQNQPQRQIQNNIIQPAKPEILKPQTNKAQNEQTQERKQGQEQIKQEKQKVKLVEGRKNEKNQEMMADIKRPRNGQQILIDVRGQKEGESQSKQIRELKQKQDQRLAKFIHLMPESEKKHLRAMATDKTPN